MGLWPGHLPPPNQYTGVHDPAAARLSWNHPQRMAAVEAVMRVQQDQLMRMEANLAQVHGAGGRPAPIYQHAGPIPLGAQGGGTPGNGQGKPQWNAQGAAQGGAPANPNNQQMLQILWARSQGDTGPDAQGPVGPMQGGGGPPGTGGPPGPSPGGGGGVGPGGQPPWPPFPFGYPSHGGQGMYPGLQGPGAWNSNWPPGAGQFGWKLDVDKEIPYFPLVYLGAHERQKVVCTPLRVSKR